jgi:phosphoglycolate phosphatase-like HAD superfamily hydrolase
MQLVLFDIDGTLVDCGRQSRPLLAAALREVFGRTGSLDTYEFSGKTDPRIVSELMRDEGVPEAEIAAGLGAVRAAYLRQVEHGLRGESIRVLPGVPELLARLAGREGVVLGLLTGNWQPAAWRKLSLSGLDSYFSFGAFGEDGVDRADLVPAALARAERFAGRPFAASSTVIVGDSLEDVQCARAHGVQAVAVATGRTSAAVLAAAGADWVIPDLWSAPHCHSALAL